MIPFDAYREAVANALVHRTWDINANTKIEMHPDKIVVSSPCGLMTDMTKEDFMNGNYSSLRNPTANKLENMISGDYILGKGFTTSLPYVIDLKGNIIVGKRNGNGRFGLQTPHPTLIGGVDPKIKMAGMLHIKNGKIAYYDDRSGHYRPNIKSMKYADEAFEKFNKFKERN